MSFKAARFPKEQGPDFIGTVRARVKEYFQEKNLKRHADRSMVIKTIFMILLYIVPYGLMISGVYTNLWVILTFWVLMGLGMAGIGLSIMHDANHGSYCENRKLNDWIGYIINAVGGSALTWKIQHNVLHHTYTNVEGLDGDINSAPLLRFSPHQKHFRFHKIQHIYGWFLYCLNTVSWAFIKDYKQIVKYGKMGLTNRFDKNYTRLVIKLIISKMAYYFFLIVLPIIVLDIPWWITLSFFFVMQFIAGFILSCIFQPAHVMPTSEYPLPDEKGNLLNTWAIHQLYTTANYAPGSVFFSWFVGGLNFQIEHHLFPNICHIHYKNISEIVKSTAAEFKLPYYTHKTFVGALINHGKMLKQLGSK